jgi:hypothetical protein
MPMLLPIIGYKLPGRNYCLFGNVSTRSMIDRICSDESIGTPLYYEAVCFEAVDDIVVLEPPWPSLLASLRNSSAA